MLEGMNCYIFLVTNLSFSIAVTIWMGPSQTPKHLVQRQSFFYLSLVTSLFLLPHALPHLQIRSFNITMSSTCLLPSLPPSTNQPPSPRMVTTKPSPATKYCVGHSLIPVSAPFAAILSAHYKETINLLQTYPIIPTLTNFPTLDSLLRERNYWTYQKSTPFTDIEFLTHQKNHLDPAIAPHQRDAIISLKRAIISDIIDALEILGVQGVFPPEQHQLESVRRACEEWDFLDRNIIVLMFTVS